MTKHNHENNDSLPEEQTPEPIEAARYKRELDVAGESLSEALRISFVTLKIIMTLLLVIFFVMGFKTVDSGERALVLRFGKIRGVGESRLLEPGLHWVMPYPIDQIIKIPVEKKINLAIDSFWYFEKESEKISKGPTDRSRIRPKLNPVMEGYCITRSESAAGTEDIAERADYSIAHTKWSLTYQIDDPERFFKNVHIEDVKPGETYFDVITKSITPLLINLVEDVVVSTMVNYTINDIIFEQIGAVTREVKVGLQEKLNAIDSGIKVVSVQLDDKTWPRQVNNAFQDSIRARQVKEQTIVQAKNYADGKLNEAGGINAEKFLETLKKGKVEPEDLSWEQLAGKAYVELAQAKAYRTSVVKDAEASAQYLKEILPEYRKNPKLVLQSIYQDAMEMILGNVDAKIVIQSAQGAREKEIRILLSKDPKAKSKK
ncbi:protease modulator HflK [Planctomycetota bacterium]